MNRWRLLTGEYPPDPGGVADYAAAVAAGLAARGERVEVWVRRAGGVSPLLPSRVSDPSRQQGADAPRSPRTRPVWLVQWVPHAFGLRSLNLPVCLWLLGRRLLLRDEVRVVFHEVAFPLVRRPRRHLVLALGHRLMAAVLLLAARRVYVTTPAWVPLLRALGGRRVPTRWLPVPATIPTADVAVDRSRFAAAGEFLVGHFGTFAGLVADRLADILPRLLEDRRVRLLLIGRGAERFRTTTLSAHADRVSVADGLPAADIAAHLRALDLAVQPYPDGATARRTSLMGCLANGVPTVTTVGRHSEPVWRTEPIVAAVEEGDDLSAVALGLLDDPARRAALGRAAADYSAGHFHIDRVIDALLADG